MVPDVAGSSPVDRPFFILHGVSVTTLEAILLGIIQGITEFLPISSSGHLKLAQSLFGFQNLQNYIVFDLVCHLGTLIAIFVMFSKEIFSMDRTRFKEIVLGTLPLFPLLLIMKPIKAMFNQPEYLGYCFMVTALLLYLGIRLGKAAPRPAHSTRDSLIIGTFQAIAILPGISRSGSTISGARMLGWTPQEAVTFSFMLAIPAILGGTVIELLQIIKHSESITHISSIQYFLGFATSFGVGYYALRLLRSLASKQKFMYFVWYCLLLGIFTTLYFNFL